MFINLKLVMLMLFAFSPVLYLEVDFEICLINECFLLWKHYVLALFTEKEDRQQLLFSNVEYFAILALVVILFVYGLFVIVVLKDLKYADSHEWVKIDGNKATFGITDHAQDHLGDVVYVELPDVGRSVSQGESFGAVESVKATSDINSPVSGTVVEVNEELTESPGLVSLLHLKITSALIHCVRPNIIFMKPLPNITVCWHDII